MEYAIMTRGAQHEPQAQGDLYPAPEARTPAAREEILRSTFGAWKGHVDGEQLKRDLNELQRDESRVLASFGAIEPGTRPEDWTAVRKDMEVLMAEDASREDSA
jgi:hypothetical protein